MTPDGPYELPGGRVPEFQEYAALILHELRRLTEGQMEMQRNIQELLRSNGLINQRIDELSKNWDKEFARYVSDFEAFQRQMADALKEKQDAIDGHDARIAGVEGREQRSLANLSGKKAVIGIAFIVFTAIVIPVINTIQALRGG